VELRDREGFQVLADELHIARIAERGAWPRGRRFRRSKSRRSDLNREPSDYKEDRHR
jgi:hypothetical protein